MTLEFSLTQEQEAIRDLAHEFAVNEMRPIAAHHDETEEFPYEVVKKAHKLGLSPAAFLPEEYGGQSRTGSLNGDLPQRERCDLYRISLFLRRIRRLREPLVQQRDGPPDAPGVLGVPRLSPKLLPLPSVQPERFHARPHRDGQFLWGRGGGLRHRSLLMLA